MLAWTSLKAMKTKKRPINKKTKDWIMTFWLAWLHLTNFQILLVNFQLRVSLPVTFGQILLTDQPLVNFWSLIVNFPSLIVNFPSLSAISVTFNHQVFWTPKSGPNADFQPKWKICFRSILGPFGPKKGKTRFFPEKRSGSILSPYFHLPSCAKSEKNLCGNFQINWEKSVFGSIWARFAQKRGNGNLSEKSGLSVFSPYGPLTPCKESEKLMNQFWEKLVTDRLPDRPTERRTGLNS